MRRLFDFNRGRGLVSLLALLAFLSIGQATGSISLLGSSSLSGNSSGNSSSNLSSNAGHSTFNFSKLATAKVSTTVAGAIPTYDLVGANGGIYTFGNAGFYGSTGNITLNKPIVGMASTPDGKGYWLVASDGGIFTFGDATYYGSTGNITLNKPIVGMAATPDGKGYWLVASDGGIFTFGDAAFYGSTGNIALNKPIVGMASTPDGKGYWLVASDGGIFTFGDAAFYGSTGNIALNKPIVGMAATPDGKGYWLVASDGGIFTFGDAVFYGSTGNITLNKPIVGMAADPTTGGYWLVASDGGIFSFNAPYIGSEGGTSLNAAIVGISSTGSLDPYTTGATGVDLSAFQCVGSTPGGPSALASVPTTGVGVVGAYFDSDPQGFGGTLSNAMTTNPCLASEVSLLKNEGATVSLFAPLWSAPSQIVDPTNTLSGPEASCAANVANPSAINCQSYNWGWNLMSAGVAWANSQGVNSPLWWVDVEYGTPGLWGTNTIANQNVIAGALAYLASTGHQSGIYSTAYQFHIIAGSYSPGVPTWIAGASGSSYCTDPTKQFGGGPVWLLQTSYVNASGVNGSPRQIDGDTAC
ncbi:hypothetical protein [Acidithrix ferrooxidans]|uniref:Uncharacterized protein n=1 Tax=Acidithrix ferrooxidans TaxID=1280514 RepID=A0A0D8HLH6_9ACTN|nr:hypothetical protein [Acidithrix ferrooxidans]KJF17926.1 hypothetical protein AXFE_12110 [Acidithrix ferrooxidans]